MSNYSSGQPVLWEELTWEQITALREDGMTMVILPVGATEQHGLHLPVGVDIATAKAVKPLCLAQLPLHP